VGFLHAFKIDAAKNLLVHENRGRESRDRSDVRNLGIANLVHLVTTSNP
jgi:hypothetical protein